MDLFKKRLRFGDHDDLTLFREVLGLNPFENPGLWDIIQENVFSVTGKKFTVRTLRKHLERIIKIWLEQTKLLMTKSGIEEQQTEKDVLCQNIYDLMREHRKEKRVKRTAADQKKEGECARSKWVSILENQKVVKSVENDHSYLEDCKILTDFDNDLETVQEEVICISEDNNAITTELKPKNGSLSECDASASRVSATPKTPILGPIRSRKRKLNAQRQGLTYLEQFDRQQVEIKNKELEVEKRKLALEEKKLELEERKLNLAEFEIKKKLEIEEKKINLEIEERRELSKIIERQDKLLNVILNKCSL